MITKIEDVASFAKYLIHEEKLSVHPDDNFFEYENYETQLPFYTKEEAVLRNKLMKQCFDLCEENGIDIYEIFYSEMEHLLIN